MLELKRKIETIKTKEGKDVDIIKYYVTVSVNGKDYDYVLDLNYKQLQFLNFAVDWK